MAIRIFLGLMTLVWLPYGIYCLFNPHYLAEAAGVTTTSPTATTELRAMYGGLQAAIGVLTATALFRPGLVRPALVSIAFLTTGLFTSRLGGALVDGSLGSAYTMGGLIFELVCAAGAGLLLRRFDSSSPA